MRCMVLREGLKYWTRKKGVYDDNRIPAAVTTTCTQFGPTNDLHHSQAKKDDTHHASRYVSDAVARPV